VLDFVSNYLDPWHRMRLGWAEPRIAQLPAGGMAVLPAAQMTNTDSPLLLFDPAKGTGEFFMLEYRSDLVNGSPSVYDMNLCSNGMAIWFIQQDSNHNPVNHPSPGVNWNKAFYPLTSPWLTIGGRALWPSGALTPFLNWYDGTSTSVRIQVRPFAAHSNSITVEWLRETSFWVDFNYSGLPQNGAFDTPFPTATDGVSASGWGGTLIFKTGMSAETLTINKRLELRAYNGPVTLGRQPTGVRAGTIDAGK
jgi:hypothetical protein